MSNAFEVALDLRDLARPRQTQAEVQELVEELLAALPGRRLTPERRLVFEAAGEGRAQLLVLAAPGPNPELSEQATVVVRGIAELPSRVQFCDVCQAQGIRRRATLGCTCKQCRPVDDHAPPARAWTCDDHAIFLTGSLRAFAPAHAPVCAKTHEPSSFVCRGPLCDPGKPWGPKRLRFDPENPDRVLCEDCHEELFPPCLRSGCNNIGTLRCEHWDSTAHAFCRKALCSVHGQRWQVFGPHRMGLERCPEHAAIPQLSDLELVAQLTIGTAGRVLARKTAHGRKRFDDYYSLPSLASVRHILIKKRGLKPELSNLLSLFESLDFKSARNREPYATAQHLLEHRARSWRNEVGRDDKRQKEGELLFERLRELVIESGFPQVARALEYSHYSQFRKDGRGGTPSTGEEGRVLFVRLDAQFRGLFIGSHGARVKRFVASLGITDIRFHDALKRK